MSKYQAKDFQPNEEVIYIPNHAYGDRTHPDCEWGRVSSVNHKYVFVKFNKTVAKLGWEGTTSQGCDPTDLEK